MKENTRIYICLALILAAVTVLGSYYLTQKSGLYIDEGMTLFLANGRYNGAVTSRTEYGFGDFLSTYVWKDSIGGTVSNIYDMLHEALSAGNYSVEGTVEWYDAARKMLQGENTWIDGKELFDEITVSQGNGFQYSQVYLNQMVDVHPPLYYFIVHTVFSLFSGSYSNFYLFGVNMFFLLATCVLLFFLIQKYWHNTAAALLAVLLYGFSQEFFSCAVFFRMYAMETFWVVLTLYTHFYLKNSGWNLKGKNKAILILPVLLGFWTHYYYILYVLPLFMITCYRFIKNRHKQKLWTYIKAMILAGVINLLFWPFSLYHILFGYRGSEAIANLNMHGIADKLIMGIRLFFRTVLVGNYFVLAFLLCMFIAGILLHYDILKVSSNGKMTVTTDRGRLLGSDWVELCIPSVVYFIVVIKVAPAVDDRYLMCLFPLVYMIISLWITNTFKMFFRDVGKSNGILACVGAGYAVVSFLFATPSYLYLEQKDLTLGIDVDKSGLNCLMIASDDAHGFTQVLRLSEFSQVMVIGQQDMDLLENDHPDNMEAGMIVYIFNDLKQETILEKVAYGLQIDEETFTEISSDMTGIRAYYWPN